MLNTAQFAEVYLLIGKFKNLVTLAFCTLLQCCRKKGCQNLCIACFNLKLINFFVKITQIHSTKLIGYNIVKIYNEKQVFNICTICTFLATPFQSISLQASDNNNKRVQFIQRKQSVLITIKL